MLLSNCSTILFLFLDFSPWNAYSILNSQRNADKMHCSRKGIVTETFCIDYPNLFTLYLYKNFFNLAFCSGYSLDKVFWWFLRILFEMKTVPQDVLQFFFIIGFWENYEIDLSYLLRDLHPSISHSWKKINKTIITITILLTIIIIINSSYKRLPKIFKLHLFLFF